MSDIARLDVEVGSAPMPGLLRAAIDAAVSEHPFPAGPESVIGRAVVTAIDQHVSQHIGQQSEGD